MIAKIICAESHEGGTTSNTVGVTLCRSKRKNSSPLKDHEPTEITKRRRNIWNESEVDTLRSGVLKFGREWKKNPSFLWILKENRS
ncbi:hypothetical protein P8452_25371 [Trifolium repens]|nr:hypothetical protein P8452_25371 [Trifolium repens]